MHIVKMYFDLIFVTPLHIKAMAAHLPGKKGISCIFIQNSVVLNIYF